MTGKPDVPVALLFGNGQAMYLDDDGDQVGKYQRDGWSGVHAFRGDFPDADVHIADWRGGPTSEGGGIQPLQELTQSALESIVDDAGTSRRWNERAVDNVQRWGNQSPATLFLALVEEVGELARELDRESTYPDDADVDAKKGKHLIRAMGDLGETTQRFLEENFEEPAGKPKPESEREDFRSDIATSVDDVDAVQDELDDAAPLLFQLTWALDDER